MAIANFAAGCFWGVEAAFANLSGVNKTTVGYQNGHTTNPTYQEVCTDKTGHAEAIQIEFDPEQISYNELLETFWAIHDPTTLNQQGPDEGRQYRSAIFYHDAAQKQAAEKSRTIAQKDWQQPIVTEITEASIFYPAEEYHQRYFERNAISCHIPTKKTH